MSCKFIIIYNIYKLLISRSESKNYSSGRSASMFSYYYFNFIAFSQHLGDTAGQIFVFFVLTVAAAESAIGLAIMMLVYRNRQTINVADLDELKG